MIDFYFDEDKAGTMEAFTVEARPALDDLTSCVDRLKMVWDEFEIVQSFVNELPTNL